FQRAASVGDAAPPPPAAIGEDVDPAGTGVDRILDQFLDHAGRAFDHFAGGDAVDDLFGELTNGHRPGFETRLGAVPGILVAARGKCMQPMQPPSRGNRLDYRIEYIDLPLRPTACALIFNSIVRPRRPVYRFKKNDVPPGGNHVPSVRASAATRL